MCYNSLVVEANSRLMQLCLVIAPMSFPFDEDKDFACFQFIPDFSHIWYVEAAHLFMVAESGW